MWDRSFYIYLSVGDTSIALMVVQVYDSKDKVVFCLSRRMLYTETRYHETEKLCLCLFFTCTKLRHILLFAEIIIICKSDTIKHAVSSCAERTAGEMDVRTVGIRYSVSTRKGSQGTSIGRPDRRKHQY
jgi:hypothetical protein